MASNEKKQVIEEELIEDLRDEDTAEKNLKKMDFLLSLAEASIEQFSLLLDEGKEKLKE